MPVPKAIYENVNELCAKDTIKTTFSLQLQHSLESFDNNIKRRVYLNMLQAYSYFHPGSVEYDMTLIKLTTCLFVFFCILMAVAFSSIRLIVICFSFFIMVAFS